MAGLYETAIDRLCTRRTGDGTVRPKVIASTATVRLAQKQIQALFNRREVDCFPAPGARPAQLLLRPAGIGERGGRAPVSRRGRAGPRAEGGLSPQHDHADGGGPSGLGGGRRGRGQGRSQDRSRSEIGAEAGAGTGARAGSGVSARFGARAGSEASAKSEVSAGAGARIKGHGRRRVRGRDRSRSQPRRSVHDRRRPTSTHCGSSAARAGSWRTRSGARLLSCSERKRLDEATGLFADRQIAFEPVELTLARGAPPDVADAKRKLALDFTEDQRVDVALATNMISVGLDITRLGADARLRPAEGPPPSTSRPRAASGRDRGASGDSW